MYALPSRLPAMAPAPKQGCVQVRVGCPWDREAGSFRLADCTACPEHVFKVSANIEQAKKVNAALQSHERRRHRIPTIQEEAKQRIVSPVTVR